ncbi:MAG TPA: hypothetical protein VIF57_19060 [Polyangia bacterium]|jgi:hypothetical protein
MTSACRERAWFWALAAIATGCGSSLDKPPCADGHCGSQVSTQATGQYNVERRLDLLFVVDDTPAIAPYADQLAAGFAALANELQAIPQPGSLHVGFVRSGSCDTSTRASACGLRAPARFLDVKPCNVAENSSLSVPGTIGCLSELGAADCAPNQPLAAALQTLDPTNADWQGFLRPDAYLEVVFVAASDDASGPPDAPTPLADFVTRLRALKTDPSAILVATIGPRDCTTTGDVDAPRLAQFTNEFGANSLQVGLCSDQVPHVVDRIVERLNFAYAPPCLTKVRDTDVATPGVQADCTVVARTVGLPGGATLERPIPSCDTGQSPCWHLQTGPCGDAGLGWAFYVDQPLDECIDGDTALVVECLSCADANDPACALPQ